MVIDRNPSLSRAVLTTKEAARFLGLSHRTLEDWRQRGGGPPFIKWGKLVRYRLVDLQTFVAGSSFNNTAEAQAA